MLPGLVGMVSGVSGNWHQTGFREIRGIGVAVRPPAFGKVSAEVESFWRAERRFEPEMLAETRERFFGESKAAVAGAQG